MTDLRQEVHNRLSNMRLSSAQSDEVIEEIATHLEFAAAELRQHGLDSEQAKCRVLTEVGNWPKLQKEIERSKENGMKDRLRKRWLPGLGTGLLAYAAQNIIMHHVGWPRVINFRGSYLVYSWQWLLVLIVTGALGAYWSRVMGGSVRDRILVALAPSEVIGTFIIGLLPLEMIVQAVIDHQLPYAMTHPTMVIALLLWMVILPAIPSIVGAALFLRDWQISISTSTPPMTA